MNPVEQEWMERYVYAVTRRLPKSQRQEVARELEELIGDMLEDGGTMESVSYTHLDVYKRQASKRCRRATVRARSASARENGT